MSEGFQYSTHDLVFCFSFSKCACCFHLYLVFSTQFLRFGYLSTDFTKRYLCQDQLCDFLDFVNCLPGFESLL